MLAFVSARVRWDAANGGLTTPVVATLIIAPGTPTTLYAGTAGNGVFKYARRDGLEALVQVSTAFIAGLPNLKAFAKLAQRVPAVLLASVLQISQESFPLERLFWFNFNGNWSLDAPEQFCNATSVVPTDPHDNNGTRALIDLHSHGAMAPFFSHTDNKDEQGFRVYAVIGRVKTRPSLCVRVGVYGDYWSLPAATIFEKPEGIQDCFYWKGLFDEENNEF